MRAAVEISMYPLTGDYRPPIQAFIDRLNTHSGLIVKTNHLATQIWGPLDRIMSVVTEEMTRSAGNSTLNVHARIDLIEWIADPATIADNAAAPANGKGGKKGGP